MATIKITFDSRSIPPDGNWNVVDSSALSYAVGEWVADLVDYDTGLSTGLSLYCTEAWTNNAGIGVASDAQGYSDKAWDYPLIIIATAPTATFEIRGLSGGETYTLKAAGFSGNASRDSLYTIDGTAYETTNQSDSTLSTIVSHTDTVVGTAVELQTTISAINGASYGYLSFVDFDYTAAPSSTTINVDIPLHINLKWDTTHQLAVTHDGGTTTLEGVTLSTPTGWETAAYSGSLPAGDSFASLAATDATLGGGGYTMQAGDILAWETQTGLTVDVNTTPVVSPAATVSGSYKIWNETGSTWTSVSTFTINDLGEVVVGSGIPVADRVTFQAMVGYLITQGYQGAGNETIQKWLLAEGISKKSFNEMLSDYLSGLGYNGPLPKQLRDWRNE